MGCVVSWYNYGHRLGMWYDDMDGVHTIKALIEEYKKVGDDNAVINLMAAYEQLKKHMIKENIWQNIE